MSFIGGVERQTTMMGRWFAGRGYRVSLLSWDEGQEDGIVVDGVRVYKICREESGLGGIRFFHPRWTGLVRAMKKANADVYYQNCGEYVTGQVAWWCIRNGRRFVYSVASDPDCDLRLPEMKTIRERVLYRYGLRHADRVIVQTRTQREMLLSGFGIESEVIPMPCLAPQNFDRMLREPSDAGPHKVLWIGRICEVKRPDRLLEIAEACPDVVFDLVGPIYDGEYAREVRRRAERIPNVRVHGPISRDRVPEFYSRADCLLCTSKVEGFPNTFLEAWSHGLPIISTFDPDNIIAKRGLGAVADDVRGLIAQVRELVKSPEQRREASERARKYYLETHTIETVMPQFEKVFLEAVNEIRAHTARRGHC